MIHLLILHFRAPGAMARDSRCRSWLPETFRCQERQRGDLAIARLKLFVMSDVEENLSRLGH
jgi:hypothetical protein